MPQPTPYTRQQNFTTWQAANPGVWPSAVDLDAELNAVKTNTDGLNTNIALIQRDDGRLRNGSVGVDQFDLTAYALLAGTLTPRGPWYTGVAYAVSDLVSVNSGTSAYICISAHTSGTFATDLANGYWQLLGGNAATGGSLSALSFIATGTGANVLPSGTTAERPSPATAGMVRWNTDLTRHEFYTGAAWVSHARLTGDTFTGTVVAPAFTQNGNAVLDAASALNGANLTALSVPTGALALLSVGSGQLAANAVNNSKLATMAANTVKANATGGVATPTDVAIASIVSSGFLPNDFRLTLTTGLPVTINDVTAAGTIYCTPKTGNRIALYSSGAWSIRTSAEFSLALSGLNIGALYDVFCYDNAGTPTLEFLQWSRPTFTVTIATPGVVTETAHGRKTGSTVVLVTSGALPTGLAVATVYYVIRTGTDTYNLATTYANAIAGTAIATSGSQSGTHSVPSYTTRATALTTQDGVLVKTGDATRRYLGTFRTTAATTTEDSATKRYLWNYYNRAQRQLYRQESTASWTYTSGLTRQANASASNQLEVVRGVSEDAVSLALMTSAFNSTSTSRSCGVGIGVNGAAGTDAIIFNYLAVAAQTVSGPITVTQTPVAGFTYYTWLEYGAGADTQTFQGSTNSGFWGSTLA